MCGFIYVYHDVNVCYYGRTMINFNKTQTVRKIQFHHIKKEVVAIFTDVFDNEHKLTSVNPNSNYYCQLNVKCAFLRETNVYYYY